MLAGVGRSPESAPNGRRVAFKRGRGPGRPHPERPALVLEAAERAQLEGWARAVTRPWYGVQRAQALLLLADGWSFAAVGRRCGVRRVQVWKWRQQWRARGLAMLTPRRSCRDRRRE